MFPMHDKWPVFEMYAGADADTATTTAENVLERGLGNRRIGIVGAVSFKQYEALRQKMPAATLVDVTRQMMQLRLLKSVEEIAFLRKGAELSDRAIEALEREIRPGMTEHDLAAIVEAAYLGSGGRTHIHYMATTPMQHPSVCVPAQIQSNRVIEKGDVLTYGDQRSLSWLPRADSAAFRDWHAANTCIPAHV